MNQPKIRIIVADDFESTLEGMKQIINSELDMQVVGTAVNGEELLQWLAENPGGADLVLLDINMPKMDGFRSLLKIRETDSDLKVLVMTGFGDRRLMPDALKLEANGFISKNRSKNEFAQAIRKIMQGETVVLPDQNEILPPMIPPPSNKFNLSPTEARLLCMVVQGKTNEQIAEILKMGVPNVQRIRRNAFAAIGAARTAEAVRIALENNLCV